MKTVVVTGASTGIGWGCVKVLIAAGSRVFGSVRKQADGDRLSAAFGPNFTPLLFDVTDEAAVAAGARQVEAALGGETLSGLVNNAGIAVPGPLLHLKIDDFEHQLAVNVTGQLIVTQAFAPLLGVDRSRKGVPGRIVMISSVGGKNAMPFLGAYSASKFALEGMSESLRRELMPFGIDVQSAGFIGFNRPAPAEAMAAARAHGVDLANHRSRIATAEMVRAADLIVAMEPAQRRLVCERYGRQPRDVIVLGDFDPAPVETRMIRDPVNESREVFDQVYDRIARCVRELVSTLRRRSD